MQRIDRSSAEHYIWGGVCDGWHLVKRADAEILRYDLERVEAGAQV